MTQEFYVTDRIIIPQCKVPHPRFKGCYELADVEIEFEHEDLEYMVLQINLDDGFNTL